MHREKSRIAIILAGALVAAVLSGCVFITRTGRLRETSRTVELGEAETVAVDVRIGAGELMLEGGADALLEADFTYNVAEWEPIVEYSVSGPEGELAVRQPDVGGITDLRVGEYRYEWDLQFAGDVPMALDVQLGAGRSNLDVAELMLTSLDVEAGAGQTTVNLDADWAEDLDVSMRGGVGEAVIYLPAEVSTRVEVDGGIGEVETMGLSREGDAYVNDAYDGGDPTLEVSIQGGVGRINLEVVE